ncbi:MAG: hypothetical protein JSS51_04545 [Planctomycetes bacterium]|nr:hypothetical protein [Planctomycetota bacterium]
MTPTSRTRWALAIETSNPSSSPTGESSGPSVAIAPLQSVQGRHRLSSPSTVERLRTPVAREDDLLPAIERLTRSQGVGAKDIGLVAVSTGPGGFTALRVSVTVAKLIAYSGGGVCVGVPSACVAAERARASGRFAVLLASKSDSAFATIFEPGWNRGEDDLHPPQGRLVTAATLSDLGVTQIVADSHLVPAIRARAEHLGVPVVPPHWDAGACLELALRLAPVTPDELLPLYPREAEAVTLWKKRHGG